MQSYLKSILQIGILWMIMFIANCASTGKPVKSTCDISAMEFNLWKEIKIGFEEKGYDPNDFNLKIENCRLLASGRGCGCDLVVKGEVCNDTDVDVITEILNNLQGMEVRNVDNEDLKMKEQSTLKFIQSNQFSFFLTTEKKLYSESTLYVGHVRTPLGPFEVFAIGQKEGIRPELRYKGLPLNLIQIEKPLKPCYRYYIPIPFDKLPTYSPICGIIIEDFNNGDNVFLVCGQQWFLAGTWYIKEEKKQKLPSHLTGYGIGGIISR